MSLWSTKGWMLSFKRYIDMFLLHPKELSFPRTLDVAVDIWDVSLYIVWHDGIHIAKHAINHVSWSVRKMGVEKNVSKQFAAKPAFVGLWWICIHFPEGLKKVSKTHIYLALRILLLLLSTSCLVTKALALQWKGRKLQNVKESASAMYLFIKCL